MNENWRQRLSRRRLEIGIEGKEYDYIQKYIESCCYEADIRCKEIDISKTVDEVTNSMKDEKFDNFTRKVIHSIHKKQGYDPYDDDKKRNYKVGFIMILLKKFSNARNP